MKAKKAGTDQEADIIVLADGVVCGEYHLPDSTSTQNGRDPDIVECFIPTLSDQAITVKGTFGGSMVHGSIDLVVDGSFLSDFRIDSGPNNEIKYKKKAFWFQKAFDNPYPPGWTSIDQPKNAYEGVLNITQLSPADLSRQHEVEIERVEAQRPGVGSIEIVLSTNQRSTEQYIDKEWDMTLGRWRNDERGNGQVRQNGIKPEFEMELREEDKVSPKRGLRHRRNWDRTRYGKKPWARFIFYYRSQEAIGEAGCKLWKQSEVQELGAAVGGRPFIMDSSPPEKKEKKRIPKKNKKKREESVEIIDDGESLFIPDRRSVSPPERKLRDLTSGAPHFGFRALGGSLFGESAIDTAKAKRSVGQSMEDGVMEEFAGKDSTTVTEKHNYAATDGDPDDLNQYDQQDFPGISPEQAKIPPGERFTSEDIFGDTDLMLDGSGRDENNVTPTRSAIVSKAITSTSETSHVKAKNKHQSSQLSDKAALDIITTRESTAMDMDLVPSKEDIMAAFPTPPASIPIAILDRLLVDALAPRAKTLATRNTFNNRVNQVCDQDPNDSTRLILKTEAMSLPAIVAPTEAVKVATAFTSSSTTTTRKRTASKSVDPSADSLVNKKSRTSKTETNVTASSVFETNQGTLTEIEVLRAKMAEQRARVAARREAKEAIKKAKEAKLKKAKEEEAARLEKERAEEVARLAQEAAEEETRLNAELEELKKEQQELNDEEMELLRNEQLDLDEEELELEESGDEEGLEGQMGLEDHHEMQSSTSGHEDEHLEGESEGEGGRDEESESESESEQE